MIFLNWQAPSRLLQQKLVTGVNGVRKYGACTDTGARIPISASEIFVQQQLCALVPEWGTATVRVLLLVCFGCTTRRLTLGNRIACKTACTCDGPPLSNTCLSKTYTQFNSEILEVGFHLIDSLKARHMKEIRMLYLPHSYSYFEYKIKCTTGCGDED